MNNIVVFNETEKVAVDKALTFVVRKDPDYHRYLCTANDALHALAHGISQYPSITDTHRLRRKTRSLSTLIQSLCNGNREDRALQTPPRAVVGKGFLIAKIHFFYLIRDMYESHRLLKRRAQRVNEHIFTNVFTLMSEDVFISMLENGKTSAGLKERAAAQLAYIWEWRLNRNIEQFAPVLFSLWNSRARLRPIYGTMMGANELLHMSSRIHPLWFDFLREHTSTAQVYQALEEFLFDLSYEELVLLRSEMARRSLAVVSHGEVADILWKQDRIPAHNGLDARWMYSFFQQRRTDAQFRIRADLPGPRKTIEELLMAFLLRREASPAVSDQMDKELRCTGRPETTAYCSV
jgi:hypothetical protein